MIHFIRLVILIPIIMILSGMSQVGRSVCPSDIPIMDGVFHMVMAGLILIGAHLIPTGVHLIITAIIHTIVITHIGPIMVITVIMAVMVITMITDQTIMGREKPFRTIGLQQWQVLHADIAAELL